MHNRTAATAALSIGCRRLPELLEQLNNQAGSGSSDSTLLGADVCLPSCNTPTGLRTSPCGFTASHLRTPSAALGCK